MTLNDLITKVSAMDYPQQLDKSYEGTCPCFWYNPIIDGHRVSIHGHCWRPCNECACNGLHISGKLPKAQLVKIGRAFKRQLNKQKWYSKYELIVESK